MPEIARIWHAEYRYRQTFPGITHLQYLDESTYEETQWMTRIHGVYERVQREKDDAANVGAAGRF